MNLATATLVRPMAGAPRNGLTWKPYTYRGTGADVLTPEIDAMPDSLFGGDVPGREPSSCGTDGGVRRHYRGGTQLCPACKQHEHQRCVERVAADIASGKTVRAVHARRGGRPWCGVWNIDDPVIAGPGETVTCKRCTNAMGRS